LSIRVAIEHRTVRRYDRAARLGPHVIRLRPAPHCRTPILAYDPAPRHDLAPCLSTAGANGPLVRDRIAGHTPGTLDLADPRRDGEHPRTLDLRRAGRA
jgi:hypothetical protein